MIVELKCDVRMTKLDGETFVAQAGRKGNYSSKRTAEGMEHCLTVYDFKSKVTVTHRISLPLDQRPEYL